MINVCIHGHFYQPPRENPWTGEIELQESAAPYHDWNERIYNECYKTNSEALIINDRGEIVEKVNNYDLINFNFGPTLLAWIKRKHPETYDKIIAADKQSIVEHTGHGNAIAMCYNHMIMPLANLNDKITQVKWGLKDFEYHFGRSSEGIWLPETACDWETIEVLINGNVRYIILDTSQAAFVRKTGASEWFNVSNGIIDPHVPYRCHSKIDAGRFIDIFFYDGPVSKAVAFDDVLLSSQNLLNKIDHAVAPNLHEEQLISVATDGETFGHHKKFTERTLAYFLKVLAPQKGFRNVNLGEYLSGHQPQYEVMIKGGEGTSWSCPHGVKRWQDDCGCGGSGAWHQKWRKPLREALDWLRGQLIVIFENHGASYFRDPWQARNDYINVMINDSSQTRLEFLSRNCPRYLTDKETAECFSLLEMQKFAMLMYTSCGWFFSEISGIETLKILEYAARAIELAKSVTTIDLENEFLKRLYRAKSNLPKYRNGKNVYLKLIRGLN